MHRKIGQSLIRFFFISFFEMCVRVTNRIFRGFLRATILLFFGRNLLIFGHPWYSLICGPYITPNDGYSRSSILDWKLYFSAQTTFFNLSHQSRLVLGNSRLTLCTTGWSNKRYKIRPKNTHISEWPIFRCIINFGFVLIFFIIFGFFWNQKVVQNILLKWSKRYRWATLYIWCCNKSKG